jgi:hypothetical protein
MQHRKGLVALAALSTFLLSGASSPSGCTTNNNNDQIGPSAGEVYGAAAGVAAVIVVGTVVLVEVHKSHHTVKGCVTSGPDGLLVHNERDQKVYALTGLTANVKIGDIVKLNGNKEKNQKDSAGDVDFMIQKMSRDYGPCSAMLAAPAAPPGPAL